MALLVILVTGLFCGCNKIVPENIVREDAPDMIHLERWGDTGGYSGVSYNKFTVNREENDFFDCFDETERLHTQEETRIPQNSLSSRLNLYSGESGYWLYDHSDGKTPAETYIEIYVVGGSKESFNKYVGYAVIKVINVGECNYSATVIKSETFPPIDGKYQDITRDQVKGFINLAKMGL